MCTSDTYTGSFLTSKSLALVMKTLDERLLWMLLLSWSRSPTLMSPRSLVLLPLFSMSPADAADAGLAGDAGEFDDLADDGEIGEELPLYPLLYMLLPLLLLLPLPLDPLLFLPFIDSSRKLIELCLCKASKF